MKNEDGTLEGQPTRELKSYLDYKASGKVKELEKSQSSCDKPHFDFELIRKILQTHKLVYRMNIRLMRVLRYMGEGEPVTQLVVKCTRCKKMFVLPIPDSKLKECNDKKLKLTAYCGGCRHIAQEIEKLEKAMQSDKKETQSEDYIATEGYSFEQETDWEWEGEDEKGKL
ncbi:hypothetical protein HY605_00135 [Candidatus Peregrinibacteria bacterium]|nr:hypothetical protein [Candidatus Peregrinibacteria bacterium]